MIASLSKAVNDKLHVRRIAELPSILILPPVTRPIIYSSLLVSVIKAVILILTVLIGYSLS
jgi:hypothetical protein